MKIATLNGSPNGRNGNSERMIEALVRAGGAIPCNPGWEHITLSDSKPAEALDRMHGAQAYLFVTGTYWDTWGSPLQRFLEEATDTEGSALWLGKPAGVIVGAHSVGAKGVLSRLQGVLNTYGCLIPPMSGAVLTAANQRALAAPTPKGDLHLDFWSEADLPVILHNVCTAVSGGTDYRGWEVDRSDPKAIWVDF